MRVDSSLIPPVQAVAKSVERDPAGNLSIPTQRLQELGRSILNVESPGTAANQLIALSRKFEREEGAKARFVVQQINLLLTLLAPKLMRPAGPPN